MDDRQRRLISRRHGRGIEPGRSAAYRQLRARRARKYSAGIFERDLAAMEDDCLLDVTRHEERPDPTPEEMAALIASFSENT